MMNLNNNSSRSGWLMSSASQKQRNRPDASAEARFFANPTPELTDYVKHWIKIMFFGWITWKHRLPPEASPLSALSSIPTALNNSPYFSTVFHVSSMLPSSYTQICNHNCVDEHPKNEIKIKMNFKRITSYEPLKLCFRRDSRHSMR